MSDAFGYGSGKRAGPKAFFQFRISRGLDAQLRQANGRFGSLNGPVIQAVRRAHERMAFDLQKDMSRELQVAVNKRMAQKGDFARTERPRNRGVRRERGAVAKTESERLREILLQNQNRDTRPATRFYVGIYEYMDASPAAPYWRRLEYGGRNPSREIALVRPIAGTGFQGLSPRRAKVSTIAATGVSEKVARDRGLVLPMTVIPAYRYMHRGVQRSLARWRGSGPQSAGGIYQEEFSRIGVKLTLGPTRIKSVGPKGFPT